MKRLIRRAPSPALVIACLALAVALGGTGYAALRLPRNSVGTVQLKNNAVVSSKVKNHTLKAVDFAAGVLPTGGSSKAFGPVTVRLGTVTIPGGPVAEGATNTGATEASCNPGERAISAGTSWNTKAAGEPLYVSSMQPILDSGGNVTGFRAVGANGGTKARMFMLHVLCYVY